MIAALDETLRALLLRELPLRSGEIDIEFEQPKREWSARLSKPTINLFLYDMRENTQLRVQQRERVMQTARNGRETHVALKRTPFRMDCYYLITTWANETEDQHNLLGAAVTALLRHPTIPAEFLDGELEDQPYKIISKLASPDMLPNVSEVWGVLDNEMRPAVPLVLTITIDPWDMEPVRMVQTLTLRTGEMGRPNQLIEKSDTERLTIGGFVFDANNRPLPNAELWIRGTGFHTQTNLQGQYRFSGLTAGEYTLLAIDRDNESVTKTVIIPNGDYNINF